jgi:type IV secretory pathway VirB6-like protein
MNFVDQIFFKMYQLLERVLNLAFLNTFNQWQGVFYTLITLAFVFLGYRMLYSKNSDLINSAKYFALIVIISVFLNHGQMVYSGLKTIFLDIWIDAGNFTIRGIQGVMGDGAAGLNLVFNPEDGQRSAFGALWDFCVTVAIRLFEEGGITNPVPILAGTVMLVAGIFVSGSMIILMASAMILAIACVIGSPLFIWMIMFKPLKPMFEKWLALGIGGGLVMYFLIILMGIVMVFMATAMVDLIGFDIVNDDISNLKDDNYDINLGTIMPAVLFSYIAYKLLPEAKSWGNSVSAVTAGGFTEIAQGAGQKISGALKAAGATATQFGKENKVLPDDEFSDTNEDSSDIRDQQFSSRIENSETEHSSSNDVQSERSSEQLVEGSERGDAEHPQLSDHSDNDVMLNQTPGDATRETVMVENDTSLSSSPDDHSNHSQFHTDTEVNQSQEMKLEQHDQSSSQIDQSDRSNRVVSDEKHETNLERRDDHLTDEGDQNSIKHDVRQAIKSEAVHQSSQQVKDSQASASESSSTVSQPERSTEKMIEKERIQTPDQEPSGSAQDDSTSDEKTIKRKESKDLDDE